MLPRDVDTGNPFLFIATFGRCEREVMARDICTFQQTISPFQWFAFTFKQLCRFWQRAERGRLPVWKRPFAFFRDLFKNPYRSDLATLEELVGVGALANSGNYYFVTDLFMARVRNAAR